MEQIKKCFKCGEEKPLTEFYKHPEMADGHLNKCKDCARNDIKINLEKKAADPKFVEKERKRGRDKYHRLYTGTGKANPEAAKNWINKFPEKRSAHLAAQHIKMDGCENHHWSYLDEHHKDVIFLTKRHHNKAHRFLIYDQERRMYRRYDTSELLDTKETHEKFIRWCIEVKED